MRIDYLAAHHLFGELFRAAIDRVTMVGKT